MRNPTDIHLIHCVTNAEIRAARNTMEQLNKIHGAILELDSELSILFQVGYMPSNLIFATGKLFQTNLNIEKTYDKI